MNARNMAELRNMLMREAQKAMARVSARAMDIMSERIGEFYAGGTPQEYMRTYQLWRTPKTEDIRTSGNEVSVKLYLDQSGSYTTGKHPTMGDVLELTNSGSFKGLRPAVGKAGYWDRAVQDIERMANDVLGETFN